MALEPADVGVVPAGTARHTLVVGDTYLQVITIKDSTGTVVDLTNVSTVTAQIDALDGTALLTPTGSVVSPAPGGRSSSPRPQRPPPRSLRRWHGTRSAWPSRRAS